MSYSLKIYLQRLESKLLSRKSALNFMKFSYNLDNNFIVLGSFNYKEECRSNTFDKYSFLSFKL